MRTTIVLDDELVQEAFSLTGVRTKRELVRLALEELIRRHRKRDLTELAGKIRLRDDFDIRQSCPIAHPFGTGRIEPDRVDSA